MNTNPYAPENLEPMWKAGVLDACERLHLPTEGEGSRLYDAMMSLSTPIADAILNSEAPYETFDRSSAPIKGEEQMLRETTRQIASGMLGGESVVATNEFVVSLVCTDMGSISVSGFLDIASAVDFCSWAQGKTVRTVMSEAKNRKLNAVDSVYSEGAVAATAVLLVGDAQNPEEPILLINLTA